MRLVRGLLALVLTLLILAMPAAVLIWHPSSPLPREWNPVYPLDPKADVTPLTQWKLSRAIRDPQACFAALDRAGATGVALPDKEVSDVCHIRSRVKLWRLGVAHLSPVETRCGIALRLAMWDHHGIQPAARAILGEEVERITHFGSYSCRNIAGSSRLSQHATANAIDVAGFSLADGRRVSVLRDWDGSGPKARFLRAVRASACDWFRLVLSPDYNAAHADHFHFDQGRWGRCR